MSVELYGLCTINGQIITAPVYGSYHSFSDGINEARLLYSTVGKKEAPDDEPCILYAPDGSWVIELERVYMHWFGSMQIEGCYRIDIGFVVAKKDGYWGVVGYTVPAVVHR